ncbi:hypothetical protein JTE90_000347 [Oedothorax gibbosus]|uniref:Peptidase S1 domain-containing protein n=1 Tax=Oedothorax gibbosus TaxID=931172 RepID=A0AAV6U1T5_9ARAC|nr:hypothetical protein JTE90_000347 [Oedothorax gibbosus]
MGGTRLISVTAALLLLQHIELGHFHEIQTRHYRPPCDRRSGTCPIISKDEHSLESPADEGAPLDADHKPSREVYVPKPVLKAAPRPRHGGGYLNKPEVDYVPRPGRAGIGYETKPVREYDYRHVEDDHSEDVAEKDTPLPMDPVHKVDNDKYPPLISETGGGYNPKPANDKDDKPPKPIDDDEYNPKPLNDKVEYPSRPIGGGGGYKPKPILDRDDYPLRPSEVGYKPKPIADKDDYPTRVVGDSGHNPKPTDDIDDYPLKPPRTGDDEDDYVPRPVGGGGSGYKPKPIDDYPSRPIRGDGYGTRPINDKDDYSPKPVRGGGHRQRPGYDRDDYPPRPVGGGHNRRPGHDKTDDYQPRPVGGGYNPRPVEDRDDYRPRPVGGGYKPRPDYDKDDYRPRPVGHEGRDPRPGYDKDDYEPRPVDGGRDHHDYKPDKKDDDGYEPSEDNNKSKRDKEDYAIGGGRPVKNQNCICVPYYQCEDGHIVTDGAGIIDARKRPVPGEDLPLDGKLDPDSCGPYHVCCHTPESSTVRPYEHRCGVRNPSGINSRILSPSNKGEADFGEWPWQAAVLKSEGKVNIFMCGGVLIDKQHVLTVAHCVLHLYQSQGDHSPKLPLKVRLGEWDTQTTSEFLSHEDYAVSRVMVHPEFVNASLKNDLAVLRLEEAVPFAPHIDSVCLPQRDEDFAQQNCVVTGWGKDAYKGGTFSNVMKEVAIQVIDNYSCEEMLRKTRLGRFFQLHDGFLCAGGEYGLDSCKGDGGGPLVCYRKDKSYALAGIVSWGIDCGQPGVPGVYTKIQKYTDWISRTTGVPLQDYYPKRHH